MGAFSPAPERSDWCRVRAHAGQAVKKRRGLVYGAHAGLVKPRPAKFLLTRAAIIARVPAAVFSQLRGVIMEKERPGRKKGVPGSPLIDHGMKRRSIEQRAAPGPAVTWRLENGPAKRSLTLILVLQLQVDHWRQAKRRSEAEQLLRNLDAKLVSDLERALSTGLFQRQQAPELLEAMKQLISESGSMELIDRMVRIREAVRL